VVRSPRRRKKGKRGNVRSGIITFAGEARDHAAGSVLLVQRMGELLPGLQDPSAEGAYWLILNLIMSIAAREGVQG
jgi:hypothetical protein